MCLKDYIKCAENHRKNAFFLVFFLNNSPFSGRNNPQNIMEMKNDGFFYPSERKLRCLYFNQRLVLKISSGTHRRFPPRAFRDLRTYPQTLLRFLLWFTKLRFGVNLSSRSFA